MDLFGPSLMPFQVLNALRQASYEEGFLIESSRSTAKCGIHLQGLSGPYFERIVKAKTVATSPRLFCRQFPRRVHRPAKARICLVYARGTQTSSLGQRMVVACRTDLAPHGVTLEGNRFLGTVGTGQ